MAFEAGFLREADPTLRVRRVPGRSERSWHVAVNDYLNSEMPDVCNAQFEVLPWIDEAS